ncbi:plasmid mobilization protein [Longitalea luteola]|uniref:plasmid mobilization protein n=1 Tax=Longitalea luteola TaxID=2812563 RepID=UPI001A96C0AF|nr:plasmid mobilization relaxosome protein MobC [Longitalea luteola]
MSEKAKRNRLVQARLTPAEYDRIYKKFSKTTCRKLSDYMRKVLLDKAVTVNMRNQSLDDFMAEMVRLRSELNAIGNNYNQLVKRLHSMEQISELKVWLTLNESARKLLLSKVEEIKAKIAQINDKWLQS